MALEFFKNSAALCFSGQIPLVCYKNYLINPDRILIFKECWPENLEGFGIIQEFRCPLLSGQILLVCYKNYLINPDRILISKECRPDNLDGFGILQEFCCPLVLWPNYIDKYERKGYLRPQFHFGVCYIWYFSTFLVRILLEKQTATEFFKNFRWNSDRKMWKNYIPEQIADTASN